MDWRSKAACKGQADLFFAEDEDPEYDSKTQQAKAICALCPVKDLCLREGLEEEFGTWGGMSQDERVQLRKQSEGQKKS